MSLADRKAAFMQLWSSNYGPEGVNIASYIVDPLEQMGYFTMPASTKYHGAEEGGLFEHSMRVAWHLMSLTSNNGLTWRNPYSVLTVGLLHDLCKVDRYVRNPDRVAPYEWIYNKAPSVYGPGHGSKSVLIAASLLSLTEEEALCIRFHMGAYEKDEWAEYSAAIKKYPNVLWTHHADMLASHVDGT